MNPWLLLIFSTVVSAIGAFFAIVGISDGTGGMVIGGWVLASIAGLGMFVALIAIAVSMGIKAART